MSAALYSPRRDPPYRLYRKISALFSLPEDSLLICHKGFSLYYTYTTGRNGLNYVPEYEIPAAKLWRLSYFVDFQKYRRYIPERVARGDVRRLGFPYHLIREDAWRLFLKRIPPYLKESYRNLYNPYETRPEFLRIQYRNFQAQSRSRQ